MSTRPSDVTSIIDLAVEPNTGLVCPAGLAIVATRRMDLFSIELTTHRGHMTKAVTQYTETMS